MSSRISNIVGRVIKLPLRDKESITELLEHGEWGVALETLCGALFEENIQVSKDIYDTIRTVGMEMEMEPETWESIEHLVQLS